MDEEDQEILDKKERKRLKRERRANLKPIEKVNVAQQVPEEDSVVDSVANWFKNIFNVCGNSSCCTTKNPYYDGKSW